MRLPPSLRESLAAGEGGGVTVEAVRWIGQDPNPQAEREGGRTEAFTLWMTGPVRQMSFHVYNNKSKELAMAWHTNAHKIEMGPTWFHL